MEVPDGMLYDILTRIPDDSFYMITVFDRYRDRTGVYCAGIFKHFIQANYAIQKSVGLPGINHQYAVIEQYHYGLALDIRSQIIESWWYVWKPNRQQFEFIDYIPDEFKLGGKLYRKSYGVS